MKRFIRTICVSIGVAVGLSGCAETQFITHAGKIWGDGSTQQQTAVNPNVQYKVGKPYQIQGRWYYPKEDWGYSEEGLASWYGDEFHGRKTANGESFDKSALTAAHRTLPMPSLVRVTNLDNGRIAVLRVNDRGPFKKGRIIDVSHEAARVLGFESQGMARVRVELLTEESKRLAMAHGADLPDDVVQSIPRSGDPITMQQTNGGMGAPPGDGDVTGQGSSFQSIQTVELTPPEPLAPQGAKRPQPSFTPPPAPYGSAQSPGFGNQESEPNVGFSRSDQTSDFAPSRAQPQAAAPVPETQGNLYLQVGAFSNQQNVERLQNQLKNLGQVQVTPLERNGRTLFRVRLGPISSFDQATVLQSRVAEFGIQDAKIISE